MFSNFSFSLFISFVLLIIMFFLDLPVSFSAFDPMFFNCSQPFNCGDIRDVFYPFWVDGRAENCGLPSYELKCQDGSAVIGMQTQSYRVLDINKGDRSLRLATMDSWKDNCPSRFVNISLPSNITSSAHNLILFYGCPSNLQQLYPGGRFSCSINGTDSNYYWDDSLYNPPPEAFSSCNISVIVPILPTLVESFTYSDSTLEDVLKHGFDVEYVMNVSFCTRCEDFGGQCGYDSIFESYPLLQPTCFCSDGQYQEMCSAVRHGSTTTKKAVLALGTAFAAVLVTVVLFLCCKRSHPSTNSRVFWKRNKKSQRAVENFLRNYGPSVPKRYNYYDIKKITSSFKDKIGEGGYGGVYKGKLVDGRLVAVKLLNKDKGDGEEFINEVASISRTCHVNIVSLLGFCFDGLKRALIYEFMVNGSLEKFIYDRNPLEAQPHLGWEKLYEIAIGVARGLEYLHRGCTTRILHFDIKPHNILLDQDFTPKISDFGLAKVCARKESIISMMGARGTAGYIAPEVFSRNFGGVSHKSDVYSYGMMVLEMVGRRKNLDVGVDHTSEIYFPHWIYKRLEQDQDLGLHGVMSDAEGDITRKMILVALWCIQTNPLDRPTMSKVVEMLEGPRELLSIPPQPFLSSPPRDPVSSSNT